MAGIRPTIHDVAREARVSRSTASRALAGGPYVSAEVDKRVHAAAARIGYVRDEGARSLKLQNSRSIGVIVSDLANSFYAELASGVGQRAEELGYRMILVDGRGLDEAEVNTAETFVAMRVRGVVATPVSGLLARELGRRGTAIVEVDREFAEAGCDAVVSANREASAELTSRLISAGHRRIALLVDETDWTTGRERLMGFREAHAQAGLSIDESLIVPSGWNVMEAKEAARALLERPDGAPTAVFAANNLLAEAVWRAALDLGYSVPDRVSLVSFDDVPWMSMVSPGVTAAAQDPALLGRTALDVLEGRLAAPDLPRQRVVLPVRILDRGSVAPPA